MKFLYVLVIVSIGLGIGVFGIAMAQERATNDTITMSVRTAPEPELIAGVESFLYFTINNPATTYSINTCTCILTIAHDGAVLLEVPLDPGEDTEFDFVPVLITFVTEGLYEMTVHGTPTVPGLFAPFEVMYTAPVFPSGIASSMSADGQPRHRILRYILLGGAVVASAIVIVSEKGKQRRIARGK